MWVKCLLPSLSDVLRSIGLYQMVPGLESGPLPEGDFPQVLIKPVLILSIIQVNRVIHLHGLR